MGRNQFRVDLGYEEMRLSSHPFLNEFAGGFDSLRRSHRDPYGYDVVDTLSDQFSSLSLHRPKHRTIPLIPSSLQVFSFSSVSYSDVSLLCFTFHKYIFLTFWCGFLLLQPLRPHGLSSANNIISNGGPKADQRLYKLDPFYEHHLSRLRKNEVSKNANFISLPLSLSLGSFSASFDVWALLKPQQDRGRVLPRQEARLHKGGLAHRNGNVLKESVGTGVFHPLQRPATKTVTSVKKRCKRLHLFSKTLILMVLFCSIWFSNCFLRYVFGWYNIHIHMNTRKGQNLTLFFTCGKQIKGIGIRVTRSWWPKREE